MAEAGFDFARLPDARRVDEVGALSRASHRAGPGARAGRGRPRRRHGDHRDAGLPRPLPRRGQPRGDDAHGAAARRARRSRTRRARSARRGSFARRHDRQRRRHLRRARRLQRRPRRRGADHRRPLAHAGRLRAARPFVRETLEEIATEEELGLELRRRTGSSRSRSTPSSRTCWRRPRERKGRRRSASRAGRATTRWCSPHHVPAAMLFVPSRGGLSHTPDEFSSPEHCELGARVLARAVRRLVGGPRFRPAGQS